MAGRLWLAIFRGQVYWWVGGFILTEVLFAFGNRTIFFYFFFLTDEKYLWSASIFINCVSRGRSETPDRSRGSVPLKVHRLITKPREADQEQKENSPSFDTGFVTLFKWGCT